MPDGVSKTAAEIGSPEFAEDRTQVNSLNNKWLFDTSALEDAQGRRVRAQVDNAWETLRYRIAQDGHTISHLASNLTLVASQTGDTSNQQTVSPVRTGAADNVAAGAVPANRIIDEGGSVATVQSMLTNTTAQLSDLTTQVVALAQTITNSNATITALLAQLVTNAGNAANQGGAKS